MLLDDANERVLAHAAQVREADHRIRNSLQILGSIIRTEARVSDNDEVRAALGAVEMRIGAVALVHDALQSCSDRGRVDLGKLVGQMCESMQVLADGRAEIVCDVENAPAAVPATIARSLLLVINEFIVNAVRHAFPDEAVGRIEVTVRREGGSVVTTVHDNGSGLPEGPVTRTGFGTNLIRMMVRQLSGDLVSDCASGTLLTLTVPLPVDDNDFGDCDVINVTAAE